MQNVEKSIDELKAMVKGEVLAELEKASIKVVGDEYNGFKDLARILNKFDKYVEKYNAEVKRINERYADKIKLEKIHNLDMDLSGEKAWINSELNTIVEKEKKCKSEAIANNLKSPGYKEARREAVEILSRFGKDLDAETTMELIKPLVEAKDRTILKALKSTSNKDTRYLYVSAITKIEEYLSTSHLELCVKDARKYISNPKEKKSLVLESGLYKYANK